ncbi:hypothetical protein DXA21_21060, partial [Parabacteroides distasonis]
MEEFGQPMHAYDL